MEIELKNINDKYSLVIEKNKIFGLCGKGSMELIDIIYGSVPLKSGEILVDGNKLTKEELAGIRKSIALIDYHDYSLNKKNIYEELISLIIKCNYSSVNLVKRINDALKLVGLPNDYLNRDFDTFSRSEKKLAQIAIELFLNPKVIIFDEAFAYFDNKKKKYFLNLLVRLRDKYNKTIILKTKDVNILYLYTNNTIIINDTVIASGNSYEVFQMCDTLQKNGIVLPDLVAFTYIAKKNKGIKLNYHKDIRDLIKDIYKHVDLRKSE